MALGGCCATAWWAVLDIGKSTLRWVVIIMGKYVIVVESGSDVTPELCERHGIVRGSVEKVGVEPHPKRVGPASWNLEYG